MLQQVLRPRQPGGGSRRPRVTRAREQPQFRGNPRVAVQQTSQTTVVHSSFDLFPVLPGQVIRARGSRGNEEAHADG
jgi:hypothetical protein